MQNSQLYGRGVVCPLDPDAEEQLRINDVSPATRVRFVAIPDEHAFVVLWGLGLFQDINDRCGTCVDDYEEDWIEPPAVAGVLAAMDSLAGAKHDPEVSKLLAELRSLAHEAHASSRPLLFVL